MLILNFADSSSGIGALGFSGTDFLVQLLTFLLAFLVLRRYAFKPIIKVMRERREVIDRGVSLGEQLEKEKEDLDNKVEELLGEARVKADEIISTAEESARQTVREAETAAREKADGIVADAQIRIEQEAARVRAKLESDIVSLVSDATSAVLQEKVDGQKD
ncbi:MAG TPA: F0F1 ATP synthase subunit B, partial [Candidatus Saccharimonadales bacterium]|nr:F0F1 ATP synthase subunit B [Candidatus Saccharimonadales bacterium]